MHNYSYAYAVQLQACSQKIFLGSAFEEKVVFQYCITAQEQLKNLQLHGIAMHMLIAHIHEDLNNHCI